MSKALVSERLTKVAYQILSEDIPLSPEELMELGKKGPTLLKNLKSKKKKDLKKLSEDDKRMLLAYVVYLRQNLTTEPKDRPNFEDAAKIMHEEVLEDGKKRQVEEELIKQLAKAGLNLE
ncbi:MAG: hypothetical protein GF334_06135 [Candidatus Altiarchaeales archaeon]|nr:hypothetical protein [Candidatus Altiarchaeales archaeon]